MGDLNWTNFFLLDSPKLGLLYDILYDKIERLYTEKLYFKLNWQKIINLIFDRYPYRIWWVLKIDANYLRWNCSQKQYLQLLLFALFMVSSENFDFN